MWTRRRQSKEEKFLDYLRQEEHIKVDRPTFEALLRRQERVRLAIADAAKKGNPVAISCQEESWPDMLDKLAAHFELQAASSSDRC